MKVNSQKYFSFSIVSLFFSLFLINFINGVPSIKDIPLLLTIPKIFIFLIFLIGIYFLTKNLTKQILIFILVCCFITGLNFLFSNNLIFYKSTVFNFFTNCLPVTLFSMALTRWDYLYNYFLKASYLTSTLTLIGYISGLLSFSDTLYSMGFSYASILFSLILLDNFFRYKRVTSLIFSLPIFFVIVLHGSRGALVCLATYMLIFLYRLFFFRKKRLQAILFVSIIGILFILRNNVIQLILQISWKFGIYSRTLMSLGSGTFTESSGRNIIYSQVLESFLDDPFRIRGINADYVLTGIYSHNFILELLYEFGIIIGIITVLSLGIIVVITIHKKHNSYKTQLLLLSLSVWFPYLMISSTIWVTPFFWLFFGIFINSRKASENEAFLLMTLVGFNR